MSKPLCIDDEAVLNSLQLGDKEAYEHIYDKYWAIMYRHARKMLQNDEEAKDVVQEVFVMLWIKAESGVIRSPLAAFLYTATRNKILDHIKHSKVRDKYLSSLKDEMESYVEPPDATVSQRELSRQIELEINALPCKMRQVFELSRRQYRTHKEISEYLNISDKTVKKQINNALHILKSKLGPLLFFF
ncbi:RNA polymerase sigma-70 factor [Pedobacter frigoris]|uniref:RNA polymerase sigma factor n=1 Tax=Pedobacter frigoris TaxID=2571272 RepID=UPI00292EF54D|nr:RNA polymerase sigma-70 factor [Pedobacter frigoris]